MMRLKGLKFRPVPRCRKVIGGCAYDTKTASVLFHGSDDPDQGAALLVNLWGVYFSLEYCYYLDPWDDGYEKIRPLTLKEAIGWAERHCPGLVEEIFGVMPEAGEGEPYRTKSGGVT